ncbi:kinase-like domain-containing protein [Gilbertella persicaria]|uniref:kinase-like domain-containing protein n=1 Tax=Gilbertella persicaria TaxID=101096 RepID=UPI00221FFEA0|nr:kinase-like domain-containing protein [Gilbertella persicaria]KAI8075787.1 kinase-like domain-containing protein [Gilbertella persicaria]
MASLKGETFTVVPQEISRHFIEPTEINQARQNICLDHQILEDEDYYDEEDESDDSYLETDFSLCEQQPKSVDSDEDEDDIVPQSVKWSFVRRLFSKLSFHTSLSQQVDYTCQPYLSKYGTLLNKRVGEGVSATVQLVQQQQDTLAVKIFRKRKRKEPVSGYMKALASEFCIASALHHENIVKTLDFVRMDEDHERFGIVMEYYPEGDMYNLIKQGRLQDTEIYSYFKQMLQGLDYLHSLGVAHRDLKPENLLVHQGQLKISDFGSADVFRVAWQDHSRLSDGLCGTTPYMAPEIFLDEGYWAPPVDVWSAGVILFCMKFDGVPFGCAQLTDANYPIYLRKRLLRQYEPFNKLAHEPRTLIYAMLNPDSQTRISVHDLLTLPWLESL